jgi:phosphate transport system protein
MTAHFEHQMERIKRMILSLGGLVEQAVQDGIRSIEIRDVQLAQRVVANDLEIDLMEVEVEEECLHALALYQPVAFDLRYIVAVLKINNDLERIGDLAVNMAQLTSYRAGRAWSFPLPEDQSRMSVVARSMLKRALDALVKLDTEAAEWVLRADDEVDDIHRSTYQFVHAGIRAKAEWAEDYISLLVMSRQLERIADHATNIAEDVLYMARGDIQRHGQRLRGANPPASGQQGPGHPERRH